MKIFPGFQTHYIEETVPGKGVVSRYWFGRLGLFGSSVDPYLGWSIDRQRGFKQR